MSKMRAVCSVVCTWESGGGVLVTGPVSIQGCPGDALPLRLLVQLEVSQCPRHCASSAPRRP